MIDDGQTAKGEARTETAQVRVPRSRVQRIEYFEPALHRPFTSVRSSRFETPSEIRRGLASCPPAPAHVSNGAAHSEQLED
jgi:hypothetical protein